MVLGQPDCAHGFEYAADQAAAVLMRANGHGPRDPSVLFDRLRQHQAKSGVPGLNLPIGLSSHPPNAERVRRMAAPPVRSVASEWALWFTLVSAASAPWRGSLDQTCVRIGRVPAEPKRPVRRQARQQLAPRARQSLL